MAYMSLVTDKELEARALKPGPSGDHCQYQVTDKELEARALKLTKNRHDGGRAKPSH